MTRDTSAVFAQPSCATRHIGRFRSRGGAMGHEQVAIAACVPGFAMHASVCWQPQAAEPAPGSSQPPLPGRARAQHAGARGLRPRQRPSCRRPRRRTAAMRHASLPKRTRSSRRGSEQPGGGPCRSAPTPPGLRRLGHGRRARHRRRLRAGTGGGRGHRRHRSVPRGRWRTRGSSPPTFLGVPFWFWSRCSVVACPDGTGRCLSPCGQGRAALALSTATWLPGVRARVTPREAA